MTEYDKRATDFFQDNMPPMLQLCQKLAMLEQEWAGIVGPEYAKRSVIAGCEIENGCAQLIVHTESAAVATSMGPLKTKLPRVLKAYLQVRSAKITIKVGPLKRETTAKPPLPAWRRRAPVLVSEETLQAEFEKAKQTIEDPELAEAMARLHAVLNRLQAR